MVGVVGCFVAPNWRNKLFAHQNNASFAFPRKLYWRLGNWLLRVGVQSIRPSKQKLLCNPKWNTGGFLEEIKMESERLFGDIPRRLISKNEGDYLEFLLISIERRDSAGLYISLVGRSCGRGLFITPVKNVRVKLPKCIKVVRIKFSRTRAVLLRRY